MKIKGCNCWQWSGPTSGKRAFLPTSMFDGWPCSYWPSYLYCQRAPCDGYNPLQLLALSHSRVRRNNCLLWVDREYLLGGVRLSCPSIVQLLSHPWSLLECHHVSISVSWVLRSLGMLFLCGLTVPQHKIFFLGQVVIQQKVSMYSLCLNPSNPLSD